MSVDQSEYVRGVEARRLTGYTYGRLQRLALVGVIRTEILPGCAPQYALADLVAIKLAKSRLPAA